MYSMFRPVAVRHGYRRRSINRRYDQLGRQSTFPEFWESRDGIPDSANRYLHRSKCRDQNASRSSMSKTDLNPDPIQLFPAGSKATRSIQRLETLAHSQAD